ncbi:ABC transporter ATP-binding protein [Haploplasma axanthum]|uniref:ABC transporter, ATP-binding protein n=1 Tax=Haploplasma axanthum TaxID=29552 RepID=A0A449BBQ9_HAPAX|nr:ABC transporter ATP-binding protein [Haploplasma axanthum]VEU79883.1 ABC transporter, ATP-binding protein [Haploplasma axanthum]
MCKILIKLKNIRKNYQNHCVLVNVNLDIYEGDFLMIIGKSGSGKSTLLNIIATLEKYDSGSIEYSQFLFEKSRNLNSLRGRNFGFVFQNYNLVEYLTMVENITLWRKKFDTETIHPYVYDIIKSLELTRLIKTPISKMSGGEKQRVAFARAVVSNPSVIFADEPTGNLDNYNKNIIMRLLSDEQKKGKTVIMVTHDLSLIKYATHVYVLESGEIKAYDNL